ncbi:MAG TPA: alginate lyase family protein [Pyrinomonadaceae bacterium]|nr:alginate lyase family protein [Pyrinomonadaceae bacterium]
MGVTQKLKRAVRGEVTPTTAMLEAIRRARVSFQSNRERTTLKQAGQAVPDLLAPFARLTPAELLSHFRGRTSPSFLPGFSNESTGRRQQELFPDETAALLAAANRIVANHSWSLLGFPEQSFGVEINWCRDPLSGHVWPLSYHRDLQLIRDDGSDVRVLWELNRLGHLLTLIRARLVTGDERFSSECLTQLRSWSSQNPYGRGPNWTCAMEVSLRAVNLLTVFEVLRKLAQFTTEDLALFLGLFQQHGTYIRNNLEFSYLATSNHYLSDVVGLLWLGLMLPEFRAAQSWRQFGLRQVLSEMNKQVLPDGADFEASTGYHRFVLELFLYSFLLCRQNGVEIAPRYWDKLRAMLKYMRGYLRPDGLAPLIGDSDSGQVLPISRRRANEHAHLLSIGAALFADHELKGKQLDQELLWTMGEPGVAALRSLGAAGQVESQAFPDAGTYVMRHHDHYLCINTNGAGLHGRGSHSHNDALSLEVTVFGQPIIVDPGTYVYSADLHERHKFRSTAYHSTVRIDGEEQNTTEKAIPFVIGDEAHPRVLSWETSSEADRIVAEHYGYERLPAPLKHRRTVSFNKVEGWWLIEDQFFGAGEHDFETRFHFAPGLTVSVQGAKVVARTDSGEVGLEILPLDMQELPALETQASSCDYGQKRDSITACWHVAGHIEQLSWRLVPFRSSSLADEES